MMATLQSNHAVKLFDRYRLIIPPGLIYSMDGRPGARVLFLTDSDETFLISFEEGMSCMDLNPQCEGGRPMVSFTARSGDKYIHQKRTVSGVHGRVGDYAFFHIEMKDSSGRTVSLPGQMTALYGYPWSDGVEPALCDIMNGIAVCRTKGGTSL